MDKINNWRHTQTKQIMNKTRKFSSRSLGFVCQVGDAFKYFNTNEFGNDFKKCEKAATDWFCAECIFQDDTTSEFLIKQTFNRLLRVLELAELEKNEFEFFIDDNAETLAVTIGSMLLTENVSGFCIEIYLSGFNRERIVVCDGLSAPHAAVILSRSENTNRFSRNKPRRLFLSKKNKTMLSELIRSRK